MCEFGRVNLNNSNSLYYFLHDGIILNYQSVRTLYIFWNESDPRSYVHYLGSSENKARKKFRPVRDLKP